MNAQIFISYRRGDSLGSTGRLYDRLVSQFADKHIFMDVDTIAPGEDFIDAIEKAVEKCSILLAVIGKNWVNITDAQGQRMLLNPYDFVRVEIRTAMDRNIRVIPVLVENAPVPNPDELPDDLKQLSRKNAIELRHTTFNSDVDRLVRSIQKFFEDEEANVREGQRLLALAEDQARESEEQRLRTLAEAEAETKRIEEQRLQEMAATEAKEREVQRQREFAETAAKEREEQRLWEKEQEEQRQRAIAEAQEKAIAEANEEQRQKEKEIEEQNHMATAEARPRESLQKPRKKGNTVTYVAIIAAIIAIAIGTYVYIYGQDEVQVISDEPSPPPAYPGYVTVDADPTPNEISPAPTPGPDCDTTFRIGEGKMIYSVAYSPGGKYVACGIAYAKENEDALQLWNVTERKIICTYPSKVRVGSCRFDPTGRYLLFGDLDSTLKLWDITRGELACEFKLLTTTSVSAGLDYSADGNSIVSCSEDGLLYAWKTESRERFTTIVDTTHFTAIKFSQNGNYVFWGSKFGKLELAEIPSGRTVFSKNAHNGQIFSVDIVTEGTLGVSGAADSRVILWDFSTGKCLGTLKEHKDIVYCVKFICGGRFLLSGARDNKMMLWDVAQRRRVHTFEGHEGCIYSIDYDAATGHAVTGSGDGTIKVWNVGQYLY